MATDKHYFIEENKGAANLRCGLKVHNGRAGFATPKSKPKG